MKLRGNLFAISFGSILTAGIVAGQDIPPREAGATPQDKSQSEIRSVIQNIRDTEKIKNPQEREIAFRKATREALLSSDSAVRERTVWFFDRNSRFDVTKLADISDECQQIYGEPCLSYILDMRSLADSNREVRLNVFTQAISDGEVRLWRGTRLSRWRAMSLATSEGMTEVSGLVNHYYRDLDHRIQERWPLDRLLLEIELRSGGGSIRDAVASATQRVLEIDDQDFATRMESDPVFRSVVFRVAGDSCRNSMDDPTCRIWVEIWEAHSARGQRLRAERAAEGAPAQEKCVPSPCPDAPWWERLQYSLMTDEQRRMMSSQF